MTGPTRLSTRRPVYVGARPAVRSGRSGLARIVAVVMALGLGASACSLAVETPASDTGAVPTVSHGPSTGDAEGAPTTSAPVTTVPVTTEPDLPTPSTSTPAAPDDQESAHPDGPDAAEMPHADPLVGLGLVDTLMVTEPGPEVPPYRRARFGDGWDYDHVTRCNTRELVLIEESLHPPQVDDRCRSTDGLWVSFYDGLVTDDPADLQIDHFIPLSDAWRSGAWAWDDERRRTFANDLTSPHTLMAVSGRSNQSKGDRSPDRWLPEDRSIWCAYSSNWVEVKARWGLSVTPAEKSTLVQILQGC